jgi:glycerol-3-phosphate dehydrogenase
MRRIIAVRCDDVSVSEDERADALDRMGRETFDVVVVGGGIVGCGAALDAASRGLSVALVERGELASGTSSRSSKLIHGGLRYLERFQLRLVREALHERALLLTRLAPGLVTPLRFLYPVRDGFREEAYVRTGLGLYDALSTGARALPRHRRLGRDETLALVPSLEPSVSAGLEYWDCTVDDAELTAALARTAASLGAAIATRTEVAAFENGGLRVTEREGDDELHVSAREIVCAAGVWTEELERLAGCDAALRLTLSKGVHIVVPHDRIESEAALIARTTDSVLLVIPWRDNWLVGTTDTRWDAAPREPPVDAEDIEYLLAQANRILRVQLTNDDVVDAFAGLRPLVAATARRTSHISREHAVVRPRDGLTFVAGGKLTTYRIAARDAIDVATRELGASPSRTDEVELVAAPTRA